jgi:hypothetical protein
MATTRFTTRPALRHLAGRAAAWALPVLVAGGLLASAPSALASQGASTTTATAGSTPSPRPASAPAPVAAPSGRAGADPSCPSGQHGIFWWQVACGTTINRTDLPLARSYLAPGGLSWEPEPSRTIGQDAADYWAAEFPILMGGRFEYDLYDGPDTWTVEFTFANWFPGDNTATCAFIDDRSPYACSASYDNGKRADVVLQVWKK